MFKKSIFTLAFLAVIGWVSAQSLQFEYGGHVYANGETVVCTHYDEDMGELLQEMQLRNLSTTSQDVMVKREIIQMVEGTQNSFCWGNCYAPSVDVSPRPQILEAGEVSAEGLLSFHQLIDPSYSGNPIPGTSIVKYYAYPAGQETEEDMICIEVWFAFNAEGIDENKIVFGHAFPNPASSVVRFNYQLPATGNVSVSVYNLLGQEVMSQQLDALQGQAVLSVSDLTEGIYFCNLKVDGRAVKTEKFVVKKF